MEPSAREEDSLISLDGMLISKGFVKPKSRVQFELEAEAVDVTTDSLATDSDPVVSITINETLTPDAMKNVLMEHSSSVKFATFNAGILSGNTLFDFHSNILLPNLKKLTIRIPSSAKISAQNPPIPQDFKRLFHFLKVVEYHELESLDIICSPDRAICIPLESAIIPCYECRDSNPLMDLIRLNRNTLKCIAIGPALNKFYLKLQPADGSLTYEPRFIQQLAVFKGFPNHPILPSWSKMLRPQKHLTKLYIAFNDNDIWNDITEAIKLSSNTLQAIKLKAFGSEPATLDLQVLKTCSRLTHLSIRYLGVQMTGWEFLPLSVKQMTLAGPVTPEDTIRMVKAMSLIEEMFVILKPIYLEEGEIFQSVNILQHPSFEFIKAAPASLKEFTVDSTDIGLDSGPIKRWIEFQTTFKLIEHSSSEFSLMRTSPPSQESEAEDADNQDNSLWPCIGNLGWRPSLFISTPTF